MSQFSRGNTRAAKLSNEQVYQMREDYASGATQSYLSRKYAVAINTVGRIVRGESRQTVAQPLAEEDHSAVQRRLMAVQETHGKEVLGRVLEKAQEVYEREIKPEKELEKLTGGN